MENENYLKDLEKCVRCGSCKAFCPTYDEEGSEAMGARGRLILLRELANRRLKPTPFLNDKIFSCILCRACEGLCPNNVDIVEDIYRGRSMLTQSDKKRRYLRAGAKFFTKRPDLSFRMLQIAQHIAFPYLAKKGFIPAGFNLPDSQFKESRQVYKVSKPRGRVAVFAGCSTNFIFPHLGDMLINILRHAGYEVVVPIGEVCCGAPLRALGLEKEAETLARKNVRVFGKLKVEAVLSPCPTCIITIKDQYPKMIGKSINMVTDISSFLIDKLEPRNPTLISRRPGSVTYHDPCHLIYGMGIKEEPRELLKKIGVNVVEKKDSGCCGFGGLFSVSYKDISDRLLRKQIESCIKTNTGAVVTSCPGCMIQLSRKSKVPVFHIIELIEDAYCSNDE